MANAKINYNNKANFSNNVYRPSEYDRIIRAEDMNEIKRVVNANADDTNTNVTNVNNQLTRLNRNMEIIHWRATNGTLTPQAKGNFKNGGVTLTLPTTYTLTNNSEYYELWDSIKLVINKQLDNYTSGWVNAYTTWTFEWPLSPTRSTPYTELAEMDYFTFSQSNQWNPPEGNPVNVTLFATAGGPTIQIAHWTRYMYNGAAYTGAIGTFRYHWYIKKWRIYKK